MNLPKLPMWARVCQKRKHYVVIHEVCGSPTVRVICMDCLREAKQLKSGQFEKSRKLAL